jgi:hypothetical protein
LSPRLSEDAGRVESLEVDLGCSVASPKHCHGANRKSKHRGQPNAKRKYK